MKKEFVELQKGSALFLILIAVVLFGALSFSIANMLRGGDNTDISDEKAGLYAGELLNYGRSLRQSVQNIRISNGCDDADISFENSIESGYTNGSNTECQVFHGNGGGMRWSSPSTDINDGSAWVITGDNQADGIGTATADLIAILPNITLGICNEVNDNFGSSPGSDAGISFAKFTGSYAVTETLDSADGNMVGCLNYLNSGNNYFFYQVLIVR